MATVTQELQNLVKQDKNIKKVYFDASGKHYLNVHSLQKGKNDTSRPQLYGSGLPSHSQLIPGSFAWVESGGARGVTEMISKGNPETLITETLTREQVLSAKVKVKGDSLVSQAINASDADKDVIAEQITGLPINVLKMLSNPKFLSGLQKFLDQPDQPSPVSPTTTPDPAE